MSISIHNTSPLPLQSVKPASVSEQNAASPSPVANAHMAPSVKAPSAAQQREELSRAIERLNEQLRKQGRALSFSMDETLNRTIIQVKDANTGEVVRQIPDETVLKVAHSIEDLKGILLNERG